MSKYMIREAPCWYEVWTKTDGHLDKWIASFKGPHDRKNEWPSMKQARANAELFVKALEERDSHDDA